MTSRGLLYTLGIVVNRCVPQWFFRFRVTSVYRLRGSGGAQPDIDVFAAERKDHVSVAQQITGYQPLDEGARQQPYLASRENRPVAAIWSATGSFDEPELGLRYDFSGGDRWWFAARVVPEARGRGVYRCLLNASIAREPLVNHFVAINPTNRRSVAAHRRFIAECLGTFVTVRMLRWTVCIGGGDLIAGRRWSLDCRRSPVVVDLNDTVPQT